VRQATGFIQKGGITAVFGASASGKSMMLQALAGRIKSLSVKGDVLLNGIRINPLDHTNSISYVSQFDRNIGILTAREMITYSCTLKKNLPTSEIEKRVNKVLKDFGIDHVADTIIGTPFIAGLSGGQKRRVDVGVEFVASPSVLLLDEPTSGLDGSISYEVLTAIRTKVKESNKTLSVMLSIHQPNSRILDLFDHILVLGNDGGMVYFGTVPDAVCHFTDIGFPPPKDYTVTDFMLQVTDTNFSDDNKFDFEGSFICSRQYQVLKELLGYVKAHGLAEQLKSAHMGHSSVIELVEEGDTPPRTQSQILMDTQMAKNGVNETSFWRQYWTLVKRDLLIAKRDLTFVYLQVALVLTFGFLIGAGFFQLNYDIDGTMTFIPGGILWIMMMMVYVNVFKVYHMNQGNIRLEHELANGSYFVFSYFCAQLTTTSLLLLTYMPGVILAYFMIGFPAVALPGMLLAAWTVAMCGDAMLGFFTKFSKDASKDVLVAQLALVILTLFGGGVFIRWDETPVYWEWLMQLSLFTHSSRMAMIDVMRRLTYTCQLAANGVCVGPQGETYRCDDPVVVGVDTTCDVSGSEVLFVSQGIKEDETMWRAFSLLVLLWAGFQLLVLLLSYFPVERLIFMLREAYYSPHILSEIASSKQKIFKLERKVRILLEDKFNRDGFSELSTVDMDEEANLQDSGSGSRKNSLRSHPPANTALIWKDVNLVLKNPKNPKVLIDKCSGSVQSGRVLALMGPSGAGKTTLLNALAGRAPYANVTGEISFGKRTLLPSDLIYVPQYDEIKGFSTVMEQIEFVGTMKCTDIPAMKERLLKLLEVLGLFQKANVLCKDLSGGELKRVSVGMGMISNPNVLFLDEPTTGLDSTAAYFLVEYLVKLARETNVAVIMTIHQPASIVFDMLQDLYLLEGGRLAYEGPIEAAPGYFTSLGYSLPLPEEGVTLPDFYLDLIYKAPDDPSALQVLPSESTDAQFTELVPSGDAVAQDKAGKEWRDLYASSEYMQKVNSSRPTEFSDAPMSSENPTFMDRLQSFVEFFLHYYHVNPGYYLYRMLYLLLSGLYVGSIFIDLDPNIENLGDYSGAIFFAIWCTLFAAVGATALVAADRRQAVEQVKNNVLTPGIYCTGQLIASIPYNVICALIFQGVFLGLTKISDKYDKILFGIALTFAFLLLMESIMFVVVEVIKDAMLSVTLALVVIGTLFLFAGFFVQVDEMPLWVRWMCYMIPTKYGYDGYLQVVFSGVDFDVMDTGTTMSGTTILDTVYGQSPGSVQPWGMLFAVFAFVLLFRLIHYGLFYRATSAFLNPTPVTVKICAQA
jgi:ABC-type multidrug transport system ATPase subunit